jgi:excisionase family DNA binding protein
LVPGAGLTLATMDQHASDLIGSHLGQRLLSAEQVADYLDVPVKTLYQWRYKGLGPRGLRVGRYLRYRPEDVEAWLHRLGAGRRGAVA